MQTLWKLPKLCKIVVVSEEYTNLIRNVKLTLNVICKRKFPDTRDSKLY